MNSCLHSSNVYFSQNNKSSLRCQLLRCLQFLSHFGETFLILQKGKINFFKMKIKNCIHIIFFQINTQTGNCIYVALIHNTRNN